MSSSLPTLLHNRYTAALQSCNNLHSTNIANGHLPIFLRAAKIDPETIKPIIEILLKNMQVNSTNDVSSLYSLAKLASVDSKARDVVRAMLSEDFIAEYKQDENQATAQNANALETVLKGGSVEFDNGTSDIPAKQVHNYNFNNVQQLALHSPGAIQSIEIRNTESLDEETTRLIEELKLALEQRDEGKVKKVLGYIADKGVDVVLQLALGCFISPR